MEEIYVPRIRDIVFDIVSGGRGRDFFIQINTSDKKIRFKITMSQSFEWFCKLNKIKLTK